MANTLIKAGHPAEMVFDDYCLEELQVHYESILRLRAADAAHWSNVVRVANNAKKRDFKKYLKELDATGYRLDKAMGRVRVKTAGFFAALSSAVTGKGKRGKVNLDGDS